MYCKDVNLCIISAGLFRSTCPLTHPCYFSVVNIIHVLIPKPNTIYNTDSYTNPDPNIQEAKLSLG